MSQYKTLLPVLSKEDRLKIWEKRIYFEKGPEDTLKNRLMRLVFYVTNKQIIINTNLDAEILIRRWL